MCAFELKGGLNSEMICTLNAMRPKRNLFFVSVAGILGPLEVNIYLIN